MTAANKCVPKMLMCMLSLSEGRLMKKKNVYKIAVHERWIGSLLTLLSNSLIKGPDILEILLKLKIKSEAESGESVLNTNLLLYVCNAVGFLNS